MTFQSTKLAEECLLESWEEILETDEAVEHEKLVSQKKIQPPNKLIWKLLRFLAIQIQDFLEVKEPNYLRILPAISVDVPNPLRTRIYLFTGDTSPPYFVA